MGITDKNLPRQKMREATTSVIGGGKRLGIPTATIVLMLFHSYRSKTRKRRKEIALNHHNRKG